VILDALDVHEGMFLLLEKKIYTVVACAYGGSAKSHRIAHVGLKSIPEGNFTEKTFSPGQKVEAVHPTKTKMQFLYKDQDDYYFMNLETFEQRPIAKTIVGGVGPYLKENDQIHVEFHEGEPVNIVFPESVELKVTLCPAGIKGGQEGTFKEATLENGQVILVPQFIKEGDVVRVNVETGKYMDRKKEQNS